MIASHESVAFSSLLHHSAGWWFADYRLALDIMK